MKKYMYFTFTQDEKKLVFIWSDSVFYLEKWSLQGQINDSYIL